MVSGEHPDPEVVRIKPKDQFVTFDFRELVVIPCLRGTTRGGDPQYLEVDLTSPSRDIDHDALSSSSPRR